MSQFSQGQVDVRERTSHPTDSLHGRKWKNCAAIRNHKSRRTCAVHLAARSPTGLIPSLEGQTTADRAIEVGVGLEIQPRVAVVRQQQGAGAADRLHGLPVGPAIQRVMPAPLAGIDACDRDALEGAGIAVTDAAGEAADQRADCSDGCAGILGHGQAQRGIGQGRCRVELDIERHRGGVGLGAAVGHRVAEAVAGAVAIGRPVFGRAIGLDEQAAVGQRHLHPAIGGQMVDVGAVGREGDVVDLGDGERVTLGIAVNHARGAAIADDVLARQQGVGRCRVTVVRGHGRVIGAVDGECQCRGAAVTIRIGDGIAESLGQRRAEVVQRIDRGIVIV